MYFCAMFIKMKNLISVLIVLAFVFAGCGEFNKIVKSSDHEFKYKKAIEFYENGEYNRASTLFQDIVRIYRGTSSAADVFYYYAKSLMGQKDYITATHYFNLLVASFPNSEYVEESQFSVGYCNYLMSPNPRLDQTVTREAIDALQLYLNRFPFGKNVNEANRIIDELQNKLVFKSYLSSRLYFDFGNYKAAVVALTNALKDYPDSQYREELMYMLLKSKYLLAMRSIEDRQLERLSDALDEYFTFIDEFPESSHRREVNRFYETTTRMLNYKEDIN